VDAKEPTIRAPGASGASPNMCVARNCPVERHFRPLLIKDGLFCISAAFKRSSCWQFRSNKRLAIGEQLIVDDSLAIPCPSIQAWPPSEPLHRFSTRTVCALRCRKWLTFHSQSPYSSKTGRFCCDWEAICMRLYGQRCFLRLFVWHSYIEVLSDSKLLQMVYNGLMTHAQLLTDATAATMLVSFDQFSDFIAIFDNRPSGGWRIFATSTQKRKRWNYRCAVEIKTVSGPRLHKFYWQLVIHLCLYRSSTVKYAVFSLYFAPCLRRFNSGTTKKKQQSINKKIFPKRYRMTRCSDNYTATLFWQPNF